MYVVGMGNAPAPEGEAKRTTGGRVEISLLKNDLEQLSAPSTPTHHRNLHTTGSAQ